MRLKILILINGDYGQFGCGTLFHNSIIQIVADEQALPDGRNGAARGTQLLFSVDYLFGEAKLPRIFYSLRKAKTSR